MTTYQQQLVLTLGRVFLWGIGFLMLAALLTGLLGRQVDHIGEGKGEGDALRHERQGARARLRQIYAASPQDVGRGPDRWARPLPPLLPRLGGIRAPVLILSGARDLPDLVALSQTVQRAIPGARRDPVQGSGHLIYIDEPEIFAAAALGFFRSYGSHGT